MARRPRESKLETRTARLKLAVRRKPYFVTIAPGIALGYRRNAGAGSWSVRCSDGHGGNWMKGFAVADDHEASNGESVLDFWQAQDKARTLARAGEGHNGDRPITVAEAVDNYQADLKARGADSRNATQIRFNLTAVLAAKPVALLNSKELRAWRNGLVKGGMKAASADRVGRVLKAALNLAATDDPRITNSSAWRVGLKRLPDTETARNVILPDADVSSIVAAAYTAVDATYGLFLETAAITGARASQLDRLEVADLQFDPVAPRLMMPSSRKGRHRRVDRKPLPIPLSLAVKLRQAAGNRPAEAPLLEKSPRCDLRFRIVTKSLGLDHTLTAYSLRHSAIVRQLLAGVPTRIVASHHDTSTAMIEKHYARYIVGDPADAITRRALLDMATPAAVSNVVPIAGR